MSALIAGVLMLVLGNNLHAATDIELGEAAYESKEYDTALMFFEKALTNAQGADRPVIQFSLGSSAYRLKQWQDATRYFSSALLTKNKRLQEKTHYNYANSLLYNAWSQFKPDSDPAKSSDGKEQYTVKDLPKVIILIEDAITHYQSALKINPINESAAHNLNEAQKLLKQLKEKQEEQKSKNKKDSDDEDKGDKKDPKDKGDKGEASDQKGDNDDPQKNPDKSDQGDDQGDDQDDPKDGSEGDPKDDTQDDSDSGDKQKTIPNRTPRVVNKKKTNSLWSAKTAKPKKLLLPVFSKKTQMQKPALLADASFAIAAPPKTGSRSPYGMLNIEL